MELRSVLECVVLVCGHFHWVWLRVDCWFTLNRACVNIFGDVFIHFKRFCNFLEDVWLILDTLFDYLCRCCLNIVWRDWNYYPFREVVWFFCKMLFDIFYDNLLKGILLLFGDVWLFFQRLCDYSFKEVVWLFYWDPVITFWWGCVFICWKGCVMIFERLCNCFLGRLFYYF